MAEQHDRIDVRTYGDAPYRVALLHGGPGAPGEMAPVARHLAHVRGVLEPLQTAASIQGQLLELKTVVETHGTLPVTLIGSSWGALLGWIFAARYPSLVSKLILVGSAPFEERYAAGIMDTRLSRLDEDERREVHDLIGALDGPSGGDRGARFARLGRLLSKADSYDPLPAESDALEPQHDVYQRVWSEAQALRVSGELLALGRQIECPVVAVHGDYDPHPAEGVEQPLARVLQNFRFVLLRHCGHHPWFERQARDEFYDILTQEVGS